MRVLARPQMREISRKAVGLTEQAAAGESIQQRFELGYTRHARVLSFGVSLGSMGFPLAFSAPLARLAK